MAAEDSRRINVSQDDINKLVAATFRIILKIKFSVKQDDGTLRKVKNLREFKERFNTIGILVCDYAFSQTEDRNLPIETELYFNAAFDVVRKSINQLTEEELARELERIFDKVGKKA